MRKLRPALRIALAGALVVLAAGLLGSAAPLFDLANLVALPFAVLGVVSAVGLAFIVRRRWKKAAMAVAALACAAMAWPPAAAPASCPDGTARLKLAWLNTQGSSYPDPIMAWLEQEQPDAVGFAEMHRGSEAVREAVRAKYPYVQSCLRREACSTLLYARQPPLAMAGLARGNPENRRALSAASMKLAVEGDVQVNLMAAHLSRVFPLGRQGEELAELESHIELPADTIVMGDFNATRRMHVLRDFAARNRLGMGAADGATWPLRWKRRPAFPVIQIDQVMAGRNWSIRALRVSPDQGSDHRGLVAELCRTI